VEILGLCFSDSVTGAATRHDPALVAVSYLGAAIASFAALDAAERLRGAAGAARRFWHLCAALVLGGGVWSMHFIAMLAYRAPLEITYDPGLTILSGLIAMVGVAVGLQAMTRNTLPRILVGGVLVGLSVATMHYMGMSAMRLPGEIFYRPGLFALSILIAMAAASVALWLAVTLRTTLQRAAAALVMAVAICGMHFTGMAGTVLAPSPLMSGEMSAGLVSGQLLAAVIVASLALILLFSLTCAYFDRRLEARAASESDRLRSVNGSLEAKVEARTADLTHALAALDDQRRRAEEANRSKSDFLANMSHELRTPLNAVIGFAEILQMKRGGQTLSANQAEAVEQIGSSGRHLLALIEEVLDFARIESGKLVVALEAVDAGRIIADVLGGFRLQAEAASVTLAGPGAGTHAIVRADPLKLRQIVANLVSNAIKYNRPGGQVTVEVHEVGDTVEVAVRDTGLGIPAERMANLFQPFDRLGREALAVEGAGLGLALTRRLVEAMGGRLAVESVADVGSTFTVGLPSAAAEELAAPPSAPLRDRALPAATGSTTLLYVEDNASNIRLMRHLVEALGGLELHVAEHPRVGLEMAELLRPDVILLDINLPEMDGFEVKARLAANPATSEIPVIALSANVLTETVARGRLAGFHGYLTKPLSISALVEAIQQAADPAPAGKTARA
jgi:signal transduction histidine kinase/ActR/RegA family two-component response regulator